jgi:hypothetical protein
MLTAVGKVDASRMVVVITTTDRIVVDHMRRVDANTDNWIRYRSEMQVEARINWHVVGGKAPYRLLDQHCEDLGIISITVMDARGEIATAKSVIREVRRTRLDDRLQPATPQAACHAATMIDQESAALKARLDAAKRERMRDHRVRRERSTVERSIGTADRIDIHRSPVEGGRRTIVANRAVIR